ncbi:adenosine deaminase family protein [bacterium]|nr:adenosine deaminase family protein [candidate division CSSED10-310 bacterium]
MNEKNSNLKFEITRDFLSEIPKAELHVHLDGSIRPATLIDLAKKRNIVLPSFTESGLMETVFKDQYEDLDQYLQGFVYTVAALQTPEALSRAAYELAEDCAKEGIRYLEIRFAPQLHITESMTIEQVLMAVDEGLENFKKHYNTKKEIVTGDEPAFNYGIICCAMRMFNEKFSEYFKKLSDVHRYSPREKLRDLASQELVLAIIDVRDRYGIPIVGFDLAGSEYGYPAEEHRNAYRIAHRHFLKKTVHAGEAYGPESIFQAITDLYADRIGHGYHLYSAHLINNPKIADPEKYVQDLAQYIADRRITIEVCLTSNKQTMPDLKDWKSHSLGKFLDAGLSVTLGTDNRTVSKTSLTDEFELAVNAFNLLPNKLKNIVIYGFKRSFFSDDYATKRKYVRHVIDYYEKIEKKHRKLQGYDG